jgi:hypothetical protein
MKLYLTLENDKGQKTEKILEVKYKINHADMNDIVDEMIELLESNKSL